MSTGMKRRFGWPHPLIASIAAALALAACSPVSRSSDVQQESGAGHQQAQDSSQLPVLVRRAVSSEISLHGLAMGRLELDENGCLRVNGGGWAPFIVWPHDTRIERAEDGRLRIVDTRTGNSAYVGDEVALVGGSAMGNDQRTDWSGLTEPVPEACREPRHFVAGGILSEEQRQRTIERAQRPPVPSPPSPNLVQ